MSCEIIVYVVRIFDNFWIMVNLIENYLILARAGRIRDFLICQYFLLYVREVDDVLLEIYTRERGGRWRMGV